MDDNSIYLQRDIKRALDDIKLLLAYIEGKEFEIKDDTVESGWLSDHLVENGLYPISENTIYRIKE